MKETATGGTKEFIYSVIWAIVLLFAGKFIINFMPSYKVAGSIITILMFCVLGFFVMTRYAAVYTYELSGYTLRVNRKIGHRNKEAETKMSDIKYIGREKPQNMPKYVYTMRSSVFPNKRVCYIIYDKNRVEHGLVFEPSDKLMIQIQKLMKEKDKKND